MMNSLCWQETDSSLHHKHDPFPVAVVWQRVAALWQASCCPFTNDVDGSWGPIGDPMLRMNQHGLPVVIDAWVYLLKH